MINGQVVRSTTDAQGKQVYKLAISVVGADSTQELPDLGTITVAGTPYPTPFVVKEPEPVLIPSTVRIIDTSSQDNTLELQQDKRLEDQQTAFPHEVNLNVTAQPSKLQIVNQLRDQTGGELPELAQDKNDLSTISVQPNVVVLAPYQSDDLRQLVKETEREVVINTPEPKVTVQLVNNDLKLLEAQPRQECTIEAATGPIAGNFEGDRSRDSRGCPPCG